jgi:hypothetical protein
MSHLYWVVITVMNGLFSQVPTEYCRCVQILSARCNYIFNLMYNVFSSETFDSTILNHFCGLHSQPLMDLLKL